MSVASAAAASEHARTAARIQLAVIARGRGRIHFDATTKEWAATPSEIESVVANAANVTSCFLGGGEPTLWRYLPSTVEIIAQSGIRPGIASDGMALANPRIVAELVARGLRDVAIQLHAPNANAHDWITGVDGSAKLAVAATKVCREAGLNVEGEIWLTKPGAAHLSDTIRIMAHLGVRSILLRRLSSRQVVSPSEWALVPRLVTSIRDMVEAVEAANREGISLYGEGFPPCIHNACGISQLDKPNGSSKVAGNSGPPGIPSVCGGGESSGTCSGLPEDYLSMFGDMECSILQSLAQRKGVR